MEITMNLGDLLEAASSGHVSFTEADAAFPLVIAMLDREADGMFQDVLRNIATSSDGQIGRCIAVDIRGGLSGLGRQRLAFLQSGN